MAVSTGQKVVIVGGVASGMSAATRLRRLDENAQITVFERSGYVSFANCGLPYYAGGVITKRSDLLLQTPQSLHQRFNINVQVNHQVTSIDRENKVVWVHDLEQDRSQTYPYDRLILAPGAKAIMPPLPGIERALSLRNIEDVDALMNSLDGTPTTAAVIGAGFVGLELAENLVKRGLSVSVIEAAPQVLAPLDAEMAALVEQELTAKGVRVYTGNPASAIDDKAVVLPDGTRIEAELVIAAIGVIPDSSLAREAGLEVSERGAIIVNEFGQTSDPDIYAAGDAVQKQDALSGEAVLVPLAQSANRHGRNIADALVGNPRSAGGVNATAVVQVFDLTIATTGWNERRCLQSGRKHQAIHIHPLNHAGYYPGATTLNLKLLVDLDSDQILGAQVVGGPGGEKRIDVIATAMQAGMKASDLANLELAYAPQFSSAKDPVNMAGFVIQNLREGLSQMIQWHQLDDYLSRGYTLIDVRTLHEHERQPIADSQHFELNSLRERLVDLPPGPLVVCCQAGLRAYLAEHILRQAGREVVNLDGGYLTWHAGQFSRRSQ